MDVASVAGIATALATVTLTALAYIFTRRTAQQAARRAIGDLANSLAMFRVEWPVVVRAARTWSSDCWPVVYGAVPREDADDLARYYAYVDVGLEFCNSVLAAAQEKHITKRALEEHYGPLVRLFVTENWPMVRDMLGHAYISPSIRSEVARIQRDGWDFDHEFAALAALSGS